MITTIEGLIVERDPDVVIEVGGVGLAVQLTDGDRDRLPPVGERVRLWTHLAVREDQWNLFGFLERETRTLYRLLLSVGGIGPRVAIGMLSRTSAAAIALALHRGDEKSLVSLPGIGKKSAARLVVELQNKVPIELLTDESDHGTDASTASSAVRATPEWQAAAAMLASMGLPAGRVTEALDSTLRDEAGLDVDPVRWVKAALRRLS